MSEIIVFWLLFLTGALFVALVLIFVEIEKLKRELLIEKKKLAGG